MIEFVSFAQEIGRPFLMPPETPKELVTVVRRAFDATLKDAAFLTEAEKAMLEVDPVTGEQMNDLIRRAYATPQAVVRKGMALIGAGAH
jgi:tripartite-type tricarboxylate transporter receptor subunit TctC